VDLAPAQLVLILLLATVETAAVAQAQPETPVQREILAQPEIRVKVEAPETRVSETEDLAIRTAV